MKIKQSFLLHMQPGKPFKKEWTFVNSKLLGDKLFAVVKAKNKMKK